MDVDYQDFGEVTTPQLPSLINTRVETKKLVNHECGAEFVQKDIQYPTEYDLNSSPTKGCSFDGDADRLIYFRKGTGKNERVDVIDGDKQFALIMMYVRELLE